MITEALALFGLYTLAEKVLPKTFSLQEKIKSWWLPAVPKASPEIERLCSLLEEHWDEWSPDDTTDSLLEKTYRIYNKSRKIVIWVANDDYGIKLTIDGSAVPLTKIDRETIWKTYQRSLYISSTKKLKEALAK